MITYQREVQQACAPENLVEQMIEKNPIVDRRVWPGWRVRGIIYEISAPPHSDLVSSHNATPSLSSHIARMDCLQAPKVCTSHYSYSSSSNIGPLVRRMFPDSEIAGNFSCGERKCGYHCTYGLGTYFQDLLQKQVNKAESFVVLFDESHNYFKTKANQMDVHVHLWSCAQTMNLLLTSAAVAYTLCTGLSRMDLERLDGA